VTELPYARAIPEQLDLRGGIINRRHDVRELDLTASLRF
jgi:hypothetical protein